MILGPLRTGDRAPREHIVERALRQHVGCNYSHNDPLGAWHSLLAELETFRTMERGRKIARQANQTKRRLCAVCGERDGEYIYGGKCQPCFDAQREERDAA